MGYRSYYYLTVFDHSGKNIEPDDVQDFHKNQIESEYDETFGEETKWYDSDKDMAEYSKKYPDLVFEVLREGEDRVDTCRTFYKNGKSQECWINISFDPFDESKLVPYIE